VANRKKWFLVTEILAMLTCWNLSKSVTVYISYGGCQCVSFLRQLS